MKPTKLAAALTLLVTHASAGACRESAVDFILLKGDALSARIEDDIRADLARIGVQVTTRLLEKADFNRAMAAGDFHMCFTETWGPPYDPHSFTAGWARPNNEAHYPALSNLEPPMTKVALLQMIKDVTVVQGEEQRLAKWRDILTAVHHQAVSLPMWSKRMPAVINRRLTGYTHGAQQWEYPMHVLQVLTGPKEVRVAPAAQTGLFQSVGRMDPHSYRPNEFFFSNWVYEGLVSYGLGGSILPSLATSWVVNDLPSGGQEYIFELRRGVRFHDGLPWDCAAAKLNFDHVLAPPLPNLDWHGWYHLPGQLRSWGCHGPYTLFLTSSDKYYPLLQELTLIRPLRMLSPASFANGYASNPTTENSCPAPWGSPAANGISVRCAGIRNVSGTGPWMYTRTVSRADGSAAELVLAANPDHWGPRGNVEVLRVVRFDSAQEVKAALLDGTLDMVVGAGVLPAQDIAEFRTRQRGNFVTSLGPLLMNTLVVLNTQKAPTNDIRLRTAIMHAVNKATIVDQELVGLEEVADSLFPKDTPYCDVDLTPRWDYDFEKASFLNCPDAPAEVGPNLGLILGLALGLGLPACLVAAGACYGLGTRVGYRLAVASAKRASPLVDEKAADPAQQTPAATIGTSV